MAIDIGSESITLSVKERTWRVEVFCEVGDDPMIRAHREKVWLRPDGSVAQADRTIPIVQRALSAIATKTFADRTGAQLASDIAAWADALRQEDIKTGERAVGNDR